VDLEALDAADVIFERAAALTLLGRGDEAAATLGAGSAIPFDEARWRTSLDGLGRVRPELASQLVDQVVRRPDVSAGAAARLLIADADRWLTAGDETQSLRRLGQAAETAPDSSDGRVAAARVAVAALRAASTPDAVAANTATLARLQQDGGAAARVVDPALGVLRQVRVARESSPPELRLFLAAEMVRDGLRAPLYAAMLFLEIARDYPASPVAPKALLAAAQLDNARADSIVAALEQRYADSPYVIVARGGAVSAFPAVEDSLRALATPTIADPKRPATEAPRRVLEP